MGGKYIPLAKGGFGWVFLQAARIMNRKRYLEYIIVRYNFLKATMIKAYEGKLQYADQFESYQFLTRSNV